MPGLRRPVFQAGPSNRPQSAGRETGRERRRQAGNGGGRPAGNGEGDETRAKTRVTDDRKDRSKSLDFGSKDMYDPLLEIVLYQPEIPHNAGAVGRTCVALPARLWLVRPLGFRLDDRYLKRSGLDYWQHLMWEVAGDWDELHRRLDGRRFWWFSKRADRLYTEAVFEKGDVLVFGNESKGLPKRMLEEHADRSLRIPIRSETRSLNLSVSVGIAAFEARRQIVGAGI